MGNGLTPPKTALRRKAQSSVQGIGLVRCAESKIPRPVCPEGDNEVPKDSPRGGVLCVSSGGGLRGPGRVLRAPPAQAGPSDDVTDPSRARPRPGRVRSEPAAAGPGLPGQESHACVERIGRGSYTRP